MLGGGGGGGRREVEYIEIVREKKREICMGGLRSGEGGVLTGEWRKREGIKRIVGF